jgi:uncharacterized protein with PIN domain
VSRTKPAEVRFYVDADLLGLARVLAGLRSDVTYPGDPGAVVHKRLRPPCPITSPAVKDTEWIPEVARRGWLIITRDRHIQAHRLEMLVVSHRRAALERADTVIVLDRGRVAARGPLPDPLRDSAEMRRLSS